jgi:hypothetical protein
MFTSYKTTIIGLVLIAFALIGFAIGLTWDQALPLALAGLGFLSAKDYNVTGGSKLQPTPSNILKKECEEIRSSEEGET